MINDHALAGPQKETVKHYAFAINLGPSVSEPPSAAHPMDAPTELGHGGVVGGIDYCEFTLGQRNPNRITDELRGWSTLALQKGHRSFVEAA
jgi:hypothetical protein